MSDAPGDTPDESLVRATLAGDESAFRELITRHKARVFGTCARFARDNQQLDDLSQEVFLRAWRKLRSFRGDGWSSRSDMSGCNP